MMQLFTVNLDLWGPLRLCPCGAESTHILLTDAEFNRMTVKSGPAAVIDIFTNHTGVDRCLSCAQQQLTSQEHTCPLCGQIFLNIGGCPICGSAEGDSKHV